MACQPLISHDRQFLSLSDHPHITSVIIRNAGGSARKAFSDILAIDSLVNFTDIAVIRHTDCGSTHFRDEVVRQSIRERVGEGRAVEVDGMTFGDCKVSPEDRCRAEVEWLRGHVFLRDELRGRVWGGVYSLETGTVESVDE